LANGLRTPWFAQLWGPSVFWANSGTFDDAGNVAAPGTVAGCPTAGCPEAGPTIYATGNGVIAGLAVDDTFLYWAEPLAGQVSKCDRSNCVPIPLSVGGFGGPFGVAVDESYVYWTDDTYEQVMRCQLPSCGRNPDILASGQNNVLNIAVYGGNVYWTIFDSPGAVMWCPRTGCGGNPSTLAANLSMPASVAADDSGVYWTNSNDGTVMACKAGSCAKPVTIATQQPAPYSIALDAVSVYFTNSAASGSVMRVAKP
jgi:hypothetical protein